MKELLKTYSIRAHEASRACDNYTCAAGFKIGHPNPHQHLRNNEREKYREIMQFPENIGLIPVAIFSIGVTWRLLVSLVCASVLRVGVFILGKTEGGPKK